MQLSNQLFAAGVCKYTVHDDDVQWDVVKEIWDQLSIKEKDRQVNCLIPCLDISVITVTISMRHCVMISCLFAA